MLHCCMYMYPEHALWYATLTYISSCNFSLNIVICSATTVISYSLSQALVVDLDRKKFAKKVIIHVHPWVCCVALLCCLFDLACFFLPSALINTYMYMYACFVSMVIHVYIHIHAYCHALQKYNVQVHIHVHTLYT